MPQPDAVVRSESDAAGVLTVWFEAADRPVTMLSSAAWDGLERALDRIVAERPVGVVLASAKPRSFLVGADLHELRTLTPALLDAFLARGQRILDRLAGLPMPTVAAINGDALGGGLEVALACRYRVAADDPHAKLGLPETTLGLVPGWGGTIRLPRVVGLEQALELMVSGRTIPPTEAARIGLVDRLVPGAHLQAVARQFVFDSPAVGCPGHVGDAAQRRAVCARFRRVIRDRSGDHLPAPLRLVDVVETGAEAGVEAGSAAERRALVELRATPAATQLLRLFFLRATARKVAVAAAPAAPLPVRTAVVVGGGTMGAAIAAGLFGAGIGVHVVEADDQAAASARARLAFGTAGAAVPVVTDWSPLTAADLVVEAVSEDPGVKRAVWQRLGEQARPDAVLATNTSSLSVADLAAATCGPDRVIGLHFFNPVARMPLVEVVWPASAAAAAVATGVAVAATLGKTPIVCRDTPGFIVDRMLFPYLHATLAVVVAGVEMAAVDAAALAWGMPAGPCGLIDEIGLDVTAAVFATLAERLGPRLAPPAPLIAAVARGWLGRKAGRGLYDHGVSAGGRPRPHAAWVELPGVASRSVAVFTAEDFADRLVAPMVDEARHMLATGVVEAAETIDLATVLGIGFPAFRGGLATFAGLVPPPPEAA